MLEEVFVHASSEITFDENPDPVVGEPAVDTKPFVVKVVILYEEIEIPLFDDPKFNVEGKSLQILTV
jgi:hypothetical protein